MFSMAKVNVGTGEDHYVIEVEAAELNSTQPQAVGSEEEENGDESNTGQASKARYLLLVTQKKVIDISDLSVVCSVRLYVFIVRFPNYIVNHFTVKQRKPLIN